MGKTEKIVVLSILSLVVVLFMWSLGGGDSASAKERKGEENAPSYSGTNPASSAAKGRDSETPKRREIKRPGAPAAGVDGPAGTRESENTRVADAETIGEGDNASGEPGDVEGAALLFAPVERGRPGAANVPAARPVQMRPGWEIVTTAGLEATVDPNMLLYRPKAEDTWESLAIDLYGDSDKAIVLAHNNEGMDEPGEIIFVPARASDVEAVSQRKVVVLQGESLWEVSERALGKGSRWQEIFKANRDVISDPDYLVPGTELTIPVE